MKRERTRAIPTGLLTLSALVLAAACAHRLAPVERDLVDAEATYAAAMREIAEHDLFKARSLLERIQYDKKTQETIEPLARLAVADATFYQDTTLGWIDARSLYLDFVTLYGAHPLAPYAQLQAGSCSLKQVNDPSRDQTLTLQAIADLSEVERRWPESNYVRGAQDFVRIARTNLAEHEFLVGRFYLKRKQFVAAVERFRKVLEEYPGYASKDKVYFYLGRALILGNNEVEGRIYMDKVASEYPDGPYGEKAREALGAARPASANRTARGAP
jgi:outer membrane assembly lipoprotein YfiO